jgi:hypothetical protein
LRRKKKEGKKQEDDASLPRNPELNERPPAESLRFFVTLAGAHHVPQVHTLPSSKLYTPKIKEQNAGFKFLTDLEFSTAQFYHHTHTSQINI